MKTLAITLAAAAALTAGAAMAQPYGYGYERRSEWMPVDQRLQILDRRIDQGINSGQLTRDEAYRLRSEFRRISWLENRYERDGLSRWERADLNRRVDALSAQVAFERRDGDRTYGYNTYRDYEPRY